MNVRKRCLATEWWQCISPVFKPIISDKDLVILKNYLSSKDSGSEGLAAWQL